MNFELFDHVFRSRITLLNILSERGYNTKPYEKFGPDEIEAMVIAGQDALRMDLEKTDTSSATQPTKCRVLYSLQKLKQRLPGFLRLLTNTDDNDDPVDPKTTEVIVMLATPEGESVVEVYHAAAYEQWSSKKLRISFFRIANLVNHPSDHILVPKHEKVNKANLPFSLTERIKLPLIRFHDDIQARILGLIPGDVVKITRPSPASGEYIMYRICSP